MGTNLLEIHVVNAGGPGDPFNPAGLNVSDLSIGTTSCSVRSRVRKQSLQSETQALDGNERSRARSAELSLSEFACLRQLTISKWTGARLDADNRLYQATTA